MARASVSVAVIIVNYNAAGFISRCLASLERQTVSPRRIILVDNASKDGSLEGLEQRFPWLEILRLDANLGFAAANNLAIRHAGDVQWVALLNPDAYAAPDWLACLLETAAQRPGYGAFGCRLLNADAPEIIDGDGDVYHVSGSVWRKHHGVHLNRVAAVEAEVFSVCAAAALYDRQAFLAVGGFDERFFCYLEDVDLGFRLRLAGYRIWQTSRCLVQHVGSGVTGGMSDFSLYHTQRNLVWTYFKNMPTALLWRYLPQHLLLNLLGVAALMRRAKGGIALRAKWDALKGLGGILRERHAQPSLSPAQRHDLMRQMAHGWRQAYRRDKALLP